MRAARSTTLTGLLLTLLSISPAASAAEPKPAPAPQAPERKVLDRQRLDLKVPDLHRIFSESQLREWANPVLPETIEEVEVTKSRPSTFRRVLGLFLPRASRPTTAADARASDATLPYAGPVAAPARMSGEDRPYDR